jgi:hypothetical protein
MINKFAKVFLIVDFAVIVFCIISSNYIWLLNTQVAFISTVIITVGSFLGYKKNIEKRVENSTDEMLISEDRDKIDEIDDPFDLYSEIKQAEEKELTTEEIKIILKEEKAKVKRNSLKNTFFSASGFASIYRIIGYVSLVLGFFILNNNGLFDVYSYLAGLFITTLSVLTAMVLNRKG